MILSLLLSIAGTAPGGACIEVDGEYIRASQLATVVPAFSEVNASLGFAPAPGARRIFAGAEIRRHLQRLHLPVEGAYFENVCVVRRVMSYQKESFAKALADALGPSPAAFEILRFGPVQGPTGTIEFTRSGFARTAAGQSQAGMWKGRLRYSASGSVPVWAEVRFYEETALLVTREDLPAGHILESGDLQSRRRPADPFNRRKAVTLDEAAGMALRRSLRAGTPLDPAVLIQAPHIKRGDAIRIEARAGSAFLTVEGTAQAAGRVGQEIPVRNLQNGRLLKARVTAKGVVAVGGNE